MRVAVATFKVESDNYDGVLKSADNTAKLMKGAKGYIKTYFLTDFENGMFGLVSLWETQKDLDDFHEWRDKNHPQPQNRSEGSFRHTYDVYEPNDE